MNLSPPPSRIQPAELAILIAFLLAMIALGLALAGTA